MREVNKTRKENLKYFDSFRLGALGVAAVAAQVLIPGN